MITSAILIPWRISFKNCLQSIAWPLHRPSSVLHPLTQRSHWSWSWRGNFNICHVIPLVEIFPKDLVRLFELLVKASIDKGALDMLIEGTEAVGGRDDPPERVSEIQDVKKWKWWVNKTDDIYQCSRKDGKLTHRLLSKLPLHAMCSLFSSWILSSNTFVKLTLNTTPSYLKWTIQGLFSCSTPSSPTTFSHLIPWPHSQSPMGIGVFVFPDGVVEGSTGGGKVPLDPVSLESWQVRHFSLVSTQFPLPSSFGFSTITRLLQPLTGLGMRTNRTRMAEMEKRGIEPCIAKGPLATTAGRVCHPEMDFNHGNWSFLRMH